MTQKILKVGTSAAVTISKETMKELGFKIGDPVTVNVDRKRKKVSITPVARDAVKRELLEWTDSFIKKYKPALEALSKK